MNRNDLANGSPSYPRALRTSATPAFQNAHSTYTSASFCPSFAAKRTRPAFARRLAAAFPPGREPRDIVVFIDKMPPSRPVRPVLAVFREADPAALDWGQVAGRDVVVADADEVVLERLRSTVQAIVDAGPRRVVLLMRRPPYAEHIVIARSKP